MYQSGYDPAAKVIKHYAELHAACMKAIRAGRKLIKLLKEKDAAERNAHAPTDDRS